MNFCASVHRPINGRGKSRGLGSNICPTYPSIIITPRRIPASLNMISQSIYLTTPCGNLRMLLYNFQLNKIKAFSISNLSFTMANLPQKQLDGKTLSSRSSSTVSKSTKFAFRPLEMRWPTLYRISGMNGTNQSRRCG
jgi:hypothetical protein